MRHPGFLVLMIATLFPAFAIASPSLYQQRARELQQRTQQASVARINQHFDLIERRFMLNLEAFAQKFGIQGEPQCRSREASRWGNYRQICGHWLCINVADSGGRSQTSIMSAEVYRDSELPSGCEVVLNSGEACAIGYLHSPKDAWMTGFGGTCIDGAGQARTRQVPFRNVKFPR